jgi:hypothetical protein
MYISPSAFFIQGLNLQHFKLLSHQNCNGFRYDLIFYHVKTVLYHIKTAAYRIMTYRHVRQASEL